MYKHVRIYSLFVKLLFRSVSMASTQNQSTWPMYWQWQWYWYSEFFHWKVCLYKNLYALLRPLKTMMTFKMKILEIHTIPNTSEFIFENLVIIIGILCVQVLFVPLGYMYVQQAYRYIFSKSTFQRQYDDYSVLRGHTLCPVVVSLVC